MIGGGEGDVILKEAGEFLSKGKGELWSPVRDHLRVETELRENMSKKELSNPSSVNVFSARAINYPLHKAMICHNHD